MVTMGLDNKNGWAKKINYKNRENQGLRLKEKKKPGWLFLIPSVAQVPLQTPLGSFP